MRDWTLILFAPTVWVGWEFWRGELLGDLSYPWAPLGYSLLKSPFLKLASIGGVYFLSFFVILVGVLLHRRMWLWVLLVLILGVGWGKIYSPGAKIRSLKVAILQPNVLPRFSYDPKEWEEVEAAYDTLISALRGQKVDLVVASESAFPGVFRFSERTKEIVDRIVRTSGAPILFGSTGVEKGSKGLRFYNRALLVGKGGKILGYYDKVRLVPFGENYPFYEYLPSFIRSINLGQGNYRRGKGHIPIRWGDVTLGVMICYESIFPYIGLKLAHSGADLLVVITSDGWFGKSIGPIEHYYLGLFRSVETGKAMVRAAKTGISAVIDADGKEIAKLGLYKRGVLIADVPIYSSKTPFTLFGFLIPPFLFFLSVLWHAFYTFWFSRRKWKSPYPDPRAGK